MQIFALKTCCQDISKTITASSTKLGQLIKDDEYIDYLVKIKKKKVSSLLIYCPLLIGALKTLIKKHVSRGSAMAQR